MPARCRFVQNVENALIVSTAKVRGRVEAERFLHGKRCGGLPEAQVAESNFIQDTEFRNNLGNVDEKRQRFANRQLQYFVDILPVIANFQNSALEARASALFADEFDVRKKLHLHGDCTIALAALAAAARNVEAKMAGGVTAALRIRRVGKSFSNSVERRNTITRLRTEPSADRRLSDNDPLT